MTKPIVIKDSPFGSPLQGPGADKSGSNAGSLKKQKRSQDILLDNSDCIVALATWLGVISS